MWDSAHLEEETPFTNSHKDTMCASVCPDKTTDSMTHTRSTSRTNNWKGNTQKYLDETPKLFLM